MEGPFTQDATAGRLQWKREIQEQAKTLFQGRRGPAPVAAQNEPDRLYGEIGRLKMELDWLKKKSGISLP